MSEDSEIDQEVVEQLRRSKEIVGPLEKVVVDAQGKLVDGHHRKVAFPDWPEEKNENIKTEEHRVLYMIHKNWHRTAKSDFWKSRMIASLAKLGFDVAHIVERTGLKQSTVYKYLPQEFKDEQKVEAGQKGGEVSALQRGAKSEDLRNLIECHQCRMGKHPNEIKIVDGKPYCLKCAPFAKHKPTENIVNGVRLEKPDESWAFREGRMKTQRSKVEEKIVAKLRGKGYNVETDISICLVSTVPDFNIVLSSGKVIHGYIDGVVHGNRRDKDESLRDLLRKREPSARIVSVDVKGDSDTEVEEKVAELEEAMKWEA